MSRAMQLPLTLSVADSVTLQAERDRADAYAREAHDRCDALEEDCHQVRDALKAAEARTLALEQQLSLTKILAESWESSLRDSWCRAFSLPIRSSVFLWRSPDIPAGGRRSRIGLPPARTSVP